ncbi:hypothetical protein KY290_010984 [Solanum tuberosum]|uniref:Integrase core domain containing protein n=1 Tax=Solanum tuberosum TaxID=4113 RepID=A0ABQ7VZB7_SOLTU|nr:hypothetical protein KY290_010984 [Solanum tuberosum]
MRGNKETLYVYDDWPDGLDARVDEGEISELGVDQLKSTKFTSLWVEAFVFASMSDPERPNGSDVDWTTLRDELVMLRSEVDQLKSTEFTSLWVETFVFTPVCDPSEAPQSTTTIELDYDDAFRLMRRILVS